MSILGIKRLFTVIVYPAYKNIKNHPLTSFETIWLSCLCFHSLPTYFLCVAVDSLCTFCWVGGAPFPAFCSQHQLHRRQSSLAEQQRAGVKWHPSSPWLRPRPCQRDDSAAEALVGSGTLEAVPQCHLFSHEPCLRGWMDTGSAACMRWWSSHNPRDDRWGWKCF